MNRTICFSIACDTDPDINFHFRKFVTTEKHDYLWHGVTNGIHDFRRCLNKTSFTAKHGKLPITWLLRSDRQIYELYGNPAFCYQSFEGIWKSEYKYESEIGWHPHLYRWNEQLCNWMPYLAKDEDLEILTECLRSLRQFADIYSVRTGWDYHSNKLVAFFDKERLIVDASAIPGSVQKGVWFHDWSGTTRYPYCPSKSNYRVSTAFPEEALRILEMPVLVRELSLPVRLIRHTLRNVRVMWKSSIDLTSWESAQWQGVTITKKPEWFFEAISQTLSTYPEREYIFFTTYFHVNELLFKESIKIFTQNLENLSCLAKRRGYTLVLTTLTNAAFLARKHTAIFAP